LEVSEKHHNKKNWRRWMWLGIPTLALVLLLSDWNIQSKEPSEEDWTPILEHLNEQLIITDGLYVYPSWHQWPHAGLTALLKGAGHPGTRLHAHPLTPLDLMRFPRVWILLPRGDSPPKALKDCTPIPLESSVNLCLWHRSGEEPKVDFIKELSKAHVERRHKGKRKTKCTWKKDRHRCKTAKRMYDVRSYVGEVGDTRRNGIFAHPYPSKGTLSIAYDAMERGKTLVVSYGLALRGVRMEQGSDVVFRVLMNKKVVHEASIDREDFSWSTLELPIPSGKGALDYAFEISAENASWRHFFFDAAVY